MYHKNVIMLNNTNILIRITIVRASAFSKSKNNNKPIRNILINERYECFYGFEVDH